MKVLFLSNEKPQNEEKGVGTIFIRDRYQILLLTLSQLNQAS